MSSKFQGSDVNLQRGLLPGASNAAISGPNGQPPSIEPELFERAKEAVSALRGRGRRANGQAGPGNFLSLRTGLRSSQLLEQLDIASWHREQTQAICA
jgi:hypothetical protein